MCSTHPVSITFTMVIVLQWRHKTNVKLLKQSLMCSKHNSRVCYFFTCLHLYSMEHYLYWIISLKFSFFYITKSTIIVCKLYVLSWNLIMLMLLFFFFFFSPHPGSVLEDIRHMLNFSTLIGFNLNILTQRTKISLWWLKMNIKYQSLLCSFYNHISPHPALLPHETGTCHTFKK